ncbi:MAG: D-alanyl-D-alanine carboxypeptidase/D-alanyl-D-alanine-endopeptidase [Planctomycetota bacterium]
MVVLGLGGALARSPAQSLALSIERAVAAAEALGAQTGVAVCDHEGRVLYRHRATEAFAPASNMKVLTAAAVLRGLGADYEFATRFELRKGRLAVTASGDPNWIRDTANAPERVFGAVAAALQRLGVKAIAGIDLLPGTFVGPLRPATWPQDQLYTYYSAPTGPFVLEQGTLVVGIDARGGSGNANVRLVAPPCDLPLRGSIDIADRAKGATYGVSDVGDAVQVRGSFYRKAPPVTVRSAMRDPAVWFAAALRHSLALAGIAVGGAASSTADTLVYQHKSKLREAVLRMLEDSSNFDAEQCLRVLGDHSKHDGSLNGGLAALKEQVILQHGGIPVGVVLVDGSGLSKENRLTPGLLAAELFSSRTGPGGAVLRECLPVAGKSGTLEERFTHTDLVGRVRAKTGWIRGASALSGLVERKDGSVRWFSILMNYDPKQNGLNKDLKALQEQIVQAIDAMEPAR